MPSGAPNTTAAGLRASGCGRSLPSPEARSPAKTRTAPASSTTCRDAKLRCGKRHGLARAHRSKTGQFIYSKSGQFYLLLTPLIPQLSTKAAMSPSSFRADAAGASGSATPCASSAGMGSACAKAHADIHLKGWRDAMRDNDHISHPCIFSHQPMVLVPPRFAPLSS